MCTRQKNLEDAQIPQTNFEEPRIYLALVAIIKNLGKQLAWLETTQKHRKQQNLQLNIKNYPFVTFYTMSLHWHINENDHAWGNKVGILLVIMRNMVASAIILRKFHHHPLLPTPSPPPSKNISQILNLLAALWWERSDERPLSYGALGQLYGLLDPPHSFVTSSDSSFYHRQ